MASKMSENNENTCTVMQCATYKEIKILYFLTTFAGIIISERSYCFLVYIKDDIQDGHQNKIS